VHVCTEAWKLVAVVLKIPCHAKQASAVMFLAFCGGHIRYSIHIEVSATAVANVT